MIAALRVVRCLSGDCGRSITSADPRQDFLLCQFSLRTLKMAVDGLFQLHWQLRRRFWHASTQHKKGTGNPTSDGNFGLWELSLPLVVVTQLTTAGHELMRR
jgi:hypothetical protein